MVTMPWILGHGSTCGFLAGYFSDESILDRLDASPYNMTILVTTVMKEVIDSANYLQEQAESEHAARVS